MCFNGETDKTLFILYESQRSLYEAVRLFVRNNHFVCNTALSAFQASLHAVVPLLLFTASLIVAHKSSEERPYRQVLLGTKDHNKHITAETSDMDPGWGTQLTHALT